MIHLKSLIVLLSVCCPGIIKCKFQLGLPRRASSGWSISSLTRGLCGSLFKVGELRVRLGFFFQFLIAFRLYLLAAASKKKAEESKTYLDVIGILE